MARIDKNFKIASQPRFYIAAAMACGFFLYLYATLAAHSSLRIVGGMIEMLSMGILLAPHLPIYESKGEKSPEIP